MAETLDNLLSLSLSWYWVAGLDSQCRHFWGYYIEIAEGELKERRRPHPDRISITVWKYLLESRAVSGEIQCKVNWPETDNNTPADAGAQCFCNFSSHQWSSNWHNWFVFFYLTICTTQHRTSGSSAVGTGEPVILKLVRTLQWIK